MIQRRLVRTLGGVSQVQGPLYPVSFSLSWGSTNVRSTLVALDCAAQGKRLGKCERSAATWRPFLFGGCVDGMLKTVHYRHFLEL